MTWSLDGRSTRIAVNIRVLLQPAQRRGAMWRERGLLSFVPRLGQSGTRVCRFSCLLERSSRGAWNNDCASACVPDPAFRVGARRSPTANPSAATRIAGPKWCRKATLKRFSDCPSARAAIPPPLEPRSKGSNGLACNRGDKAMWIVLYIATIASLRAMGLALVPVEIDKERDRGPYGDL